MFGVFEADEFDEDDPLRIATAAVLSQIKADIEDSDYNNKFTVKALLRKLKDNGVNISHSQLLELVKEEPWSNLITDIKGDEGVKFKGEPDEDLSGEEPDETSGTMDKMAKRAAKKSENPF